MHCKLVTGNVVSYTASSQLRTTEYVTAYEMASWDW